MNAPITAVIRTATDPHNVTETFANGPINMQNMGNLVTLTFTSVRPNTLQLTSDAPQPTLTAIVVSRLTLPIDVAVQLKQLLNNGLVPIQLETKQ